MRIRRTPKPLQRLAVALCVVVILVFGSLTLAGAQVTVDPSLATYERVGGVSGNLNSIGSDTLNNLMTLWADGFRSIYLNVNIQIEGKRNTPCRAGISVTGSKSSRDRRRWCRGLRMI